MITELLNYIFGVDVVEMEIGCNPMSMDMACIFGASLVMTTLAATTTITMVQVAGCRFKDYVRVG